MTVNADFAYTSNTTAEAIAEKLVASERVLILTHTKPDGDAIGSCLSLHRGLRQLGITTPVIMLTAKSQTFDKVLGLKLGADDYLTKPFDMLELLARVEALLRRSANAPTPPPVVYEFGDIKLDPRSTEVTRSGELLTISAKEYQLLLYLVQHPGVTLSREVLLREVWGYDSMPTTRTVDVHVAWLRQKIEDDAKHPRWITTIHGMGYKFKPE